VAHRGADAVRHWIAGILVEPARLRTFIPVPDAERLQRLTDRRDRGPVEVLKADVVRHSHVLAELALSKPHERAVYRFGAHRLRAQARAKFLAGSHEGAHTDQVQADLDRFDDLEG
jgi:hypothetical protein